MKKLLFILIIFPISLKSQEKLTESILERQIHQETRGIHLIGTDSVITSYKGAKGIAQFMPDTWEWLKYTNKIPDYYDINNEQHQREAHLIFMNYLFNYNYGVTDSQIVLSLASYNAGISRVKKLIKNYGKEWKTYLPTETKNYINLIYLNYVDNNNSIQR